MQNKLKNSNNNDNNLITILFCIGFFIWIFEQSIFRTEFAMYLPSKLSLLFRILGVAISSMTMLYSENRRIYPLRFLIGLIAIGYLALNNFLKPGTQAYFDIGLFIFFSRNINYEKFLKWMMYFLGIFYSTVIISSLVGIIPNIITSRDGTIRNNLGFQWTTFSVHAFLYFVSVYTIYRNKKISIIEIFVLELINYWLYIKTDTRSPFYLITLFLIALTIINIKKIDLTKYKVFNVFFVASIPLLSALIYYLSTHAYEYLSLNNALSGRLVLGYKMLSSKGLSLFGRYIEFNSDRNVYGLEFMFIDSSYLQYLIRFGIISFVIMMVAWMFLQIRMVRSRNTYMCIAFLLIAVNGLIDPQFVQQFYNMYFVLLGMLFSPVKNNSLDFFMDEGINR